MIKVRKCIRSGCPCKGLGRLIPVAGDKHCFIHQNYGKDRSVKNYFNHPTRIDEEVERCMLKEKDADTKYKAYETEEEENGEHEHEHDKIVHSKKPRVEKSPILVNNAPYDSANSANSANLDSLPVVTLMKSFASSSASIQSFTDVDFTNPNININDFFGAQHWNDMATSATSHGASIGADHKNALCDNAFDLSDIPFSSSHGTATSLSIVQASFPLPLHHGNSMDENSTNPIPCNTNSCTQYSSDVINPLCFDDIPESFEDYFEFWAKNSDDNVYELQE